MCGTHAEHAIITIAPPVAPKFQKELKNRFIISFLLVSWPHCTGRCSTNVASSAHI